MAWHDINYGKHSWQLPKSSSRHTDPKLCSRVFAEALLGGQVLPSMKGKPSYLQQGSPECKRQGDCVPTC